jgi:hypothetical protein
VMELRMFLRAFVDIIPFKGASGARPVELAHPRLEPPASRLLLRRRRPVAHYCAQTEPEQVPRLYFGDSAR